MILKNMEKGGWAEKSFLLARELQVGIRKYFGIRKPLLLPAQIFKLPSHSTEETKRVCPS